MAWNKTVTDSTGTYELIPAGSHIGTLAAVFDVGTHIDNYKGQTTKREILIAVYLLAKRTPGGRNYVIGEKYNYTYFGLSKWRSVVSAFLGRRLRDGESIDPRNLLGQQALLVIEHTQSGENTYHRVESVAPLPEGVPAPPWAKTYDHQIVAWGVADDHPFPVEHESWLPLIYGETIKSIAERSLEMSGTTNRPGPASTDATPTAAQAKATEVFNEFAAKVPF